MRMFLVLVWLWALSTPGLAQDQQGSWLARFAKFEHFSVDEGLSQNTVYSIAQDHQGFIWMGTQSGLNRYDGQKFKVFDHHPDDPTSLSGRCITQLLVDRDGQLWIATQGEGLNLYQAKTQTFTHFRHQSDDTNSISSDMIYALFQDKRGDLWVGTENGLNRFIAATNSWQLYNGLPHHSVHTIAEDNLGRLWVGTARGLSVLDSERKNFRHWKRPDEGAGLVGNHVKALLAFGDLLYVGTPSGLSIFDLQRETFTNYRSIEDTNLPLDVDEIYADDKGRIWLASTNGAVYHDPDSKHFRSIRVRDGDDTGLRGNNITALFQDASGIMWLGNASFGASKLNPYSERIIHIPPGDGPSDLPHGTVIDFHQDRKGRFWITMDGGGLVQFDPETGRFFNHRTYNSYDPQKGPSDNNLWSIMEDERGILWITSHNGLNRFDPDRNLWRHYKHNPKDPESISFNKAYSNYIDREGRLWIATFGSGLDLMVDESGKFKNYQYNPDQKNALSSSLTLYVTGDRRGYLWVGTYGSGLNLYRKKSDDFRVFQSDPNDPNSIPDDTITNMLHDSMDRLWVATSGGMARFHYDSQTFSVYNRNSGMKNEVCYALIEDQQGFIWVSTNGGLARLDPETERFSHLDTSHNLQSNEFNQLSAHSYGSTLFFGGVNGFNIFNPGEVERHESAPSVVFTAFKMLNSKVPLNPVIEAREEVEISYRDTLISFEFAALDFLDPKLNQYAYRLEGFNDQEIFLGTKHDLTFTNLDPGNYTLHVRAANADGVWGEESTSLKLKIVPPFWQTSFAYGVYSFLILCLILGFWFFQRKSLVQAETVNSRLRDLDRLKDEFLANTSHELRTPLGGMIGIAESLLEGAAGNLNPSMKENLGMIVSNGRRLGNMISDLLDFSKMKHQSLSLKVSPVDVYAVSKVVSTLFEPLIDRKPLSLIMEVPSNLPLVLADENRLQQILYNLVDNAIKFTKEGEICLSAKVKGKFVEVTVSDTGIGIPKERQEDIFISFQQLDGSDAREYAGAGLGLAVTRQLVELHNGEINVYSKEDLGSRFTFTVPISEEKHKITLDVEEQIKEPVVEQNQDQEEGAYDETQFQILVVDDERVNRTILNNLLKLQGYHVAVARDGQEALNMLFGSRRFDLILLDVMMPRMTGYDVCRALRDSFSLQELPVIFLTAKNQLSDMQTGFQLGANDYLTKPFAKDELLSRVRMHLSLLDIHRNLETMVADRTAQLERQYQELETLDVIVQTINREVHMEDVLQVVLSEGLRLFPQADSGSFLLLDNKHEFYRVAAASGYSEALARKVKMKPTLVHTRYKTDAEELEQGIYIVRNPPEHTRPEPVKELEAPKALLTMEVTINGAPEGFLVLDHSTSSQGFNHADVRRLQRLREHIVSAISRARLLKNLAESQRDLVEAAHMFGMADNASLVLHNMGNKLNSVNTSVQMLRERMERARWSELVTRMTHLLNQPGQNPLENKDQLEKFTELFGRVFQRADTWKSEVTLEIDRLEDQVNDVILALRAQWDYTAIQGAVETTDVIRLLQSCAHQEERLIRHGVVLQEHYDNLPLVPVQKVKLMRVFSCLLENSVDAIIRTTPPVSGMIHLEAHTTDGAVVITITDNGQGISSSDLGRLFTQGFSTKTSAPGGFGLHNCANALHEMGGTLTLHSDGLGKGAKAVVTLSLEPEESGG